MVRYRLLGPLEVESESGRIDVGPPKRRAVLAALLLARGRVVSADRLVEAAWGLHAPDRSTSGLHVHVSSLRKVLGGQPGCAWPIMRRPPGYVLDVDPEHIDLTAFENESSAARSAVDVGRWHDALAASEAALRLWRGPLLEDLGEAEWFRGEAARINELNNENSANHVTALLAFDRFGEALNEAAQLRVADPYRERGCWLHMMALYRAGRGPEALDAFAACSRQLSDDLGLDPGQDLRELQSAILHHAPELARWPHVPAPAAPAEPGSARAVSLVRRIQLVGRHREITAITDLLGDVATRATRWLVLTGLPGIGKTRLAEESIAKAASTGAASVWVTCPDERSTPPWWTMRQIARALGADTDELFTHRDEDPAIVRFHIYERLHLLFEAHLQPTTIVIDDIQWADATSMACLAYLAGAVRNAPLLFVATVRDGQHTDGVELLMSAAVRANGNRRITVGPLAAPEVRALASQVCTDPLTEDDAAELTMRTGGNPFFVLEYARLPRREWKAMIPLAVRTLLKRRIVGMEPTALDMLRSAAVVGDTVDTVLLARSTGQDLDELARCLDVAVREQILTAAYCHEEFTFVHSLLREEIIASMPAMQVQRLHAGIAAALSDSGADDAVARRAQHLISALPAVDPIAVVKACRLAAEQAERQGSRESARRWWRAALDAYDLLPAATRVERERDALQAAATRDS
ncbi:MAG: AAA family ATPase [Actinobacteria bacterium]|nr:AAA family ATPase [Actinomycetota bacterium]